MWRAWCRPGGSEVVEHEGAAWTGPSVHRARGPSHPDSSASAFTWKWISLPFTFGAKDSTPAAGVRGRSRGHREVLRPPALRIQGGFSLTAVSGPSPRSAGFPLQVAPAGGGSCSEDTGGQCPGPSPSSHGTFFHGRNSYQNHSKKQKPTHKRRGIGFCTGSVRFVFLYHFAYKRGICRGNLKTEDLCFYGFLRKASLWLGSLLGGALGRAATRGSLLAGVWHSSHDGLFSGRRAFF